MWNFIIFLILPPKTILGPITGGSRKNKDLFFNNFIRSFFFPLFYYLTNLIFLIRYEKLVFSKNLLNKKLKRSFFNVYLILYIFF